MLTRKHNMLTNKHRFFNFNCHVFVKAVQKLQLFPVPFTCMGSPGLICYFNNTQLQTSLRIRHLSNFDGGRKKGKK